MRVGPGPVARALLDVAVGGDDHRAVAARICRACTAGTGVDGAALSVLTTTEHRETLFSTDATAATVEDLQFTLGEGACIQAGVSGRPVLVPDIHEPALTTRWPVFAAVVAEQTGVRALFALPLQLGAINVGVIDLYRRAPGPLRGYELRDVVAATDAATLLLLGAQARPDADGRPDDGLHPDRPHPSGPGDGDPRPQSGPDRDRPWEWVDRAEVHQATGMILAQLDIPARDAFVRLRAYAFAHRRPLAEVARDVVTRRLVLTDDTG